MPDCRAMGGQYVAIRYNKRLAKAVIEPSMGSVGDACYQAPGRDHQRPLQSRGLSQR